MQCRRFSQFCQHFLLPHVIAESERSRDPATADGRVHPVAAAGTAEIRRGSVLGPARLPPALVPALRLPLPGLRLRVLHRRAPDLRPLRHPQVRAPEPPVVPQPRARRPHQPRLQRFRQPQHQARRRGCRHCADAGSAAGAEGQDRRVQGQRGGIARGAAQWPEAAVGGRIREGGVGAVARHVPRGVQGRETDQGTPERACRLVERGCEFGRKWLSHQQRTVLE